MRGVLVLAKVTLKMESQINDIGYLSETRFVTVNNILMLV